MDPFMLHMGGEVRVVWCSNNLQTASGWSRTAYIMKTPTILDLSARLQDGPSAETTIATNGPCHPKAGKSILPVRQQKFKALRGTSNKGTLVDFWSFMLSRCCTVAKGQGCLVRCYQNVEAISGAFLPFCCSRNLGDA
eukprot:1394865-Amphidinium_carterae.2